MFLKSDALLCALRCLLGLVFIVLNAAAQAPGPLAPTANRFDPARYIRIVEESGKDRILLYDPSKPNSETTILRVDADSKIVVELDEAKLSHDMPLNELFMSARLNRNSGESALVNMEVLNYAEISKDPATLASQAGVALRTASSIFDLMNNLVYTVGDMTGALWPACAAAPYAKTCDTSAAPADAVLKDQLALYKPELDSFAAFFTSDKNTLIVSLIGSEVFGMDLASLRGAAKQLQDSANTFATGQGAQSVAKTVFLSRFLLLRRDLHLLENNYRDAKQAESFFDKEWKAVVLPRFQQLLVPGVIDLARYKATDGEIATLLIQARGAGGEGNGGASREFRFVVKNLRTRLSVTPTAFYLRRFSDVRDDQGAPRRVNFVPAPGVTFGPTFFNRGLTKDASGTLRPGKNGPTLMSALTPGIGVNVSFMNFTDRDFDPSAKDATGKVVGAFKSTTSSSVQLGTGFTLSLFNNALQGTVGWNLNVAEKRMYWGIGFGFIQVGEQIAKFVKK